MEVNLVFNSVSDEWGMECFTEEINNIPHERKK